ncbi:MAG: phosphate ABC transporter permease subunit PstC [Gammaproteobacteria bacterium]|nr:phosphate ABC transporter permease subunit PstC [Gammaproteobacteria bacterium]
MRLSTIILTLAVVAIAAFVAGRQRALASAGGARQMRDLHSLPNYYGYQTAIAAVLPALALLIVWLSFADQFIVAQVVSELPASYSDLGTAQLNLVINDIRNLAVGNIAAGAPEAAIDTAVDRYLGLRNTSMWLLSLVSFAVAMAGMICAYLHINPNQRARNRVEQVVKIGLVIASSIAVLTTVGILMSVLLEAIRFFQEVSVTDFLFGLTWSPQTAIRADQVGSSGSFGAVPLFVGTMLVSLIAMCVAVPIGLLVAIYLSEYASSSLRKTAKPLLEVLAGIPTVVYGYFAAITVAPLIRNFGLMLGLDVASESALTAGLVMGVMIIPFVSSLSDDVINSVPQSLRDGSYGLGATQSETIKRVVFPAALPGIVSAVLLAMSRAIGETMIVVMAAGLAANLTVNPLESVTTVTVQIVTLLVGDQEFDSAKTLAAFGLGLTLLLVTLVLNVIALQVVRKYQEQYD